MHVSNALFATASFPFMRLFSSLPKWKQSGDARRPRPTGKEEYGYSSDEASTNDGAILERELGKKMKGRTKESALRPGQVELQRKMREMNTLKTYLDELAAEELQHVREARQEKAKRDALFPINPLPLFLFIMNALVSVRRSHCAVHGGGSARGDRGRGVAPERERCTSHALRNEQRTAAVLPVRAR